MTTSGPVVTAPIEIAIACYPGAQATCIHGLTDLFTYAAYFAREHAGSSEPFLRVTHWRPYDGDRMNGGSDDSECTFDTLPGAAHAPRVVIVPACQIAPPGKDLSPSSAAWVRKHHADGAVAAAVCGGVFLLADTGLLEGRRVTTHWMFAAELRHRFPKLLVDPDRLVIDDGDVITAGGVLAWADMGLSLVERLLGPTVMSSTAHFMLADPPGREQRFYGGFAPRLQHGDKEILAIQHWMQANHSGDCSVDSLANRCGLGARTFLRRFTHATGVNPGEYHQRLRIARGQELLEFTRDPVEKVAQASGYADAGGFRRTFKRVTGLAPAEYRRKFQRARGDS